MQAEELKNLLRRYGLRPNFTYGQNFLLNDSALVAMLDAAGINQTDAILEVGPGIGNLTALLLANAKFVLSIEKDKSFLPVLKKLKREHKNFRYEFADILKFDFSRALEGHLNYKVVANIPYYITGKIIQLFLRAKKKPESITVLLQKEVARNIVAKSGEYNLLALSVQLFGEPKIIRNVPAADFYPQPKVDSAILHIELFEKPKYELEDEKKFFRVLRACFAGKRKQLHNTLVNNLRLDKFYVADVLKKLKIDPAARPQELSIEQWINLADKISLP